jgi:hypothetical protein
VPRLWTAQPTVAVLDRRLHENEECPLFFDRGDPSRAQSGDFTHDSCHEGLRKRTIFGVSVPPLFQVFLAPFEVTPEFARGLSTWDIRIVGLGRGALNG